MGHALIEMQRRTGERLRAARERLGLSKSEAAQRVGLTRRELAAYERGRWRVPETTMARLARAYGLETGDVVPSRSNTPLEIDADRVAAGETERRVSTDATSDEVLGEYLDLVRELRGIDENERIPLRDADLAVLAEALGGTPEKIEARLIDLIDCSREEAQAIRKAIMKRRLAAPAAGFLLGIGGLSPSIAGADAGEPVAPAAAVTEASDEAGDVVDDVIGEVDDTVDEVANPDGDAGSDEGTDEGADRGDDWAEIIEPLVIERDSQ